MEKQKRKAGTGTLLNGARGVCPHEPTNTPPRDSSAVARAERDDVGRAGEDGGGVVGHADLNSRE
jgi:hypothetical protein